MTGPALYLFAVSGSTGRMLLGRPVLGDDGDPWGRLAPLRRDAAWGPLVPEVSAEAMSHALHGYLLPLQRQAGLREPRASLRAARRALPVLGACLERDRCAAHDPETCAPCARAPACYVPPAPPGAEAAAREVIRAWCDGYVVVVPVGDEFVLRG